MSNRFRSSAQKAGLPPGSLIYVGKKPINDVKITVIDYNVESLNEKVITKISECFACKETETVSWINIDGIPNPEVIQALGKHFELHSLTLEDILNTEIRPKVEFYGNYILVIFKMLDYNDQTKEIEAEQVGLIFSNKYVLSFQEDREGDVFDPIRTRIRNAAGKTRRSGTDFLMYTLIDTVVDNYYIVLEKIGERIEDLEDEIIQNPTHGTLQLLYKLKRELIFLRKAVWPLREIISVLYREETPLIKKDTHKYLRDVYDHCIQVIDTIESYRDILSGLLDIYLSGTSNKTNEIMKVLTIISTIFIPLTFIAGVYGMNFENMPELKWKYGYHSVMGVMFVIAVIMLYWFRRKKWL